MPGDALGMPGDELELLDEVLGMLGDELELLEDELGMLGDELELLDELEDELGMLEEEELELDVLWQPVITRTARPRSSCEIITCRFIILIFFKIAAILA